MNQLILVLLVLAVVLYVLSGMSRFLKFLLIPMKVVGDSDLIPVAHSETMPVTVGAKRRWRSYSA